MTPKELLLQKVDAALNSIRPYLKNDGGDVMVADISDDMVAKVVLLGACGSCPFSVMTLKNGIEQAIKRDVPEIKEVIALQDEELTL